MSEELKDEERKIWNVYLDRETGERFMREARSARAIGDGWYIGRTPALMTRTEAESWANALAALGQKIELGVSKASTWRQEENPKPEHSPILVRETDDHNRQFVLTWREGPHTSGWETDGLRSKDRRSYLPITLSDEIRSRRVEWTPLAEVEPEPGSGWRTDMTPLPKDSPILVREPQAIRDRPMSLLYWNEAWNRWEIGDVFLQGDPLAPGALEWIPLSEYRGQS